MNKFKSKKKIKIKFRYLIYVVIVFLIYELFIYVSTNLKIVRTNEQFISRILSNSNYHLAYNQNYNNLFSYILRKYINNPTEILKNQNENKITISQNLMFSSYEQQKTIYIYSTHDLEEYDNSILKNYNITTDVNMAKILLSKKLNDLGFNVIIENKKTSEILKNNNLDDYFKASRIYLQETIKNNDIDLFIDLHSDDVSRDITTTEIDNKKYAKVIFSVGRKNKDYMNNYNIVENLNRKIKEKYPDLTRGIILDDNSTYNQDLSSNMILINIGGYQNTIDEVLNTIDLISPLIKEICYEKAENS